MKKLYQIILINGCAKLNSILRSTEINGKSAVISEGKGAIGIRAEYIRLSLDAMYRLCERYINKAIVPDDFSKLHDRY